MTDLKRFADYLIEIAETQPEATLGQMQLILNRFEPAVSASAFKVLVPSVCAWQAVWDKCVQLGLNSTDKTDSGKLVCDFIDKLHSAAKSQVGQCENANQIKSNLERENAA